MNEVSEDGLIQVVQGAMITNCVCLVPAVLGLMSRSSSESRRGLKSFVDVLAILCQVKTRCHQNN